MKKSLVTKSYILLFLLLGTIYSCKKDSTPPSVVHPTNNDTAFTYSINKWQATFHNSTNTSATVTWDFGDGQQGTGDSVTHQYANPGDYTVKMTVDTNAVVQTITLKERIIQITTSFGSMYMYLYNQTPKHRDNFLALADSGYYDSTTFHRIVPNFVIQGGDPNSKGADQSQDGYGGPGYNIDFENPAGITHIYGAVGAASDGAGQPSSGSQFYVVVQSGGAHELDGSYTVFGFIMKGMNVAQQIVSQPANANNLPNTNIRMSMTEIDETKAEVLANYGYTVQ